MLRVLLLFCCLALPVCAHKPSESFLTITVQQRDPDVAAPQLLRMTDLFVKWQVAIRDLDYLLALDINNDSKIIGSEFKAQKSMIIDYLFSKIKLQAFSEHKAEHGHSHGHHHHHHSHSHLSSHSYDATSLKKWIGAYCKRSEQIDLLIEKHDELSYAVLLFDYQCKEELDKLSLDYNLLFDEDPEHRALFDLNYEGKSQAYVLTKNNRHIKAKLGKVDYGYQFFNFLDQGKWHIWTGWDHILFLLSLLFAAVLIPGNFKSVILAVVKIVTAFTIAHSITLSLAALQVVNFDSQIIEAIIALSIAVAALANLFRSSNVPAVTIAFVFGLIHGFGFAGALQDLGLPLPALLLSLFSFNLGVELGQLAIVVVFVPIAYWLRDTWFYRNIVLKLGSLLILILALWWFFERI